MRRTSRPTRLTDRDSTTQLGSLIASGAAPVRPPSSPVASCRTTGPSLIRGEHRPHRAIRRRRPSSAWAPAGSVQSPPSSVRNARSASTVRRLGPCSIAAEQLAGRRRRRPGTPPRARPARPGERTATPGAPRSGGRPGRAARSATAATTMASNSSALASRVAMLPAQLGEHEVRSERGQLHPSPGRTGGDDAVGRAGRPAGIPPAHRGHRPARARRRSRARRGDARAGPSPSAPPDRHGRRSPRPAPPWRTRPCHRSRTSGTSVRRSPSVDIGTSSTRESRARRAGAGRRRGAPANGPEREARVAIRTRRGTADRRSVQDRSNRSRSDSASRSPCASPGRVLQPHGRARAAASPRSRV